MMMELLDARKLRYEGHMATKWISQGQYPLLALSYTL